MFKLLGCFVFFLSFGLILVMAPLLHFVGRLFGFGRNYRPDPTFDPEAHKAAHGDEPRGGGKIYEGNEGEYVDFEDIPSADSPERQFPLT